jgi:hypothetical protein
VDVVERPPAPGRPRRRRPGRSGPRDRPPAGRHRDLRRQGPPPRRLRAEVSRSAPRPRRRRSERALGASAPAQFVPAARPRAHDPWELGPTGGSASRGVAIAGAADEVGEAGRTDRCAVEAQQRHGRPVLRAGGAPHPGSVGSEDRGARVEGRSPPATGSGQRWVPPSVRVTGPQRPWAPACSLRRRSVGLGVRGRELRERGPHGQPSRARGRPGRPEAPRRSCGGMDVPVPCGQARGPTCAVLALRTNPRRETEMVTPPTCDIWPGRPGLRVAGWGVHRGEGPGRGGWRAPAPATGARRSPVGGLEGSTPVPWSPTVAYRGAASGGREPWVGARPCPAHSPTSAGAVGASEWCIPAPGPPRRRLDPSALPTAGGWRATPGPVTARRRRRGRPRGSDPTPEHPGGEARGASSDGGGVAGHPQGPQVGGAGPGDGQALRSGRQAHGSCGAGNDAERRPCWAMSRGCARWCGT